MSLYNPSIKKNISKNDIHLWVIHPEQITAAQDIELLKSVLSEDEKKKVNAYRRKSAQHSALVSRALLRNILAAYTNIPAQQLLFNYSDNGKPTLSNSPIPIHFNISHNSKRLICAVSLNDEIGCDIESYKRKLNVQSIAKRYFSNDDFADIVKLAPPLQQRRFFEYWTLKEAFVKCTGLGLSQGLDSFSFKIGKSPSEQHNSNIQFQFTDPVKQSHDNYRCLLLYPDDEHFIAVCVNRQNSKAEKQPANISIFATNGELKNTISY